MSSKKRQMYFMLILQNDGAPYGYLADSDDIEKHQETIDWGRIISAHKVDFPGKYGEATERAFERLYEMDEPWGQNTSPATVLERMFMLGYQAAINRLQLKKE